MIIFLRNTFLFHLIFCVPFFLGTKLFASSAKDISYLQHRAPISMGTLETFKRVIDFARKNNHAAVVIELDTPGGYLESTREIVQLFLNSDHPKIIVWVSPQGAHAASAGSMITMAAHFAAMAPSTSIGAATPINAGGEDITKDLKQKVENDTVSFVKGIATSRGRNADWAEQSVSQATSSTAEEALKLKVIDAVVDSPTELWQAARIKFPDLPENYNFFHHKPNLKENILGFFSNPNVAYALLSFGALCIYVEITNPGILVPGIIGALSLGLGAITMNIVPIRPGAIALLILGLFLLAIEFLTAIPTFGAAGIIGIASLFLSGVFLMDPNQTNLTLNLNIWLPIFLVVSGFMVWLGWAAVKALKNPGYAGGTSALLGKVGTIESIKQNGELLVRVHGELWGATPIKDDDNTFLVGDEVIVKDQKGFKVFVTKN